MDDFLITSLSVLLAKQLFIKWVNAVIIFCFLCLLLQEQMDAEKSFWSHNNEQNTTPI